MIGIFAVTSEGVDNSVASWKVVCMSRSSTDSKVKDTTITHQVESYRYSLSLELRDLLRRTLRQPLTMSTSDAPYTYAQTTLVRANPAQTEFTRQDTFPLWGEPKGFDLAMYLERDRVMEQEEWSVEGGFATW